MGSGAGDDDGVAATTDGVELALRLALALSELVRAAPPGPMNRRRPDSGLLLFDDDGVAATGAGPNPPPMPMITP